MTTKQKIQILQRAMEYLNANRRSLCAAISIAVYYTRSLSYMSTHYYDPLKVFGLYQYEPNRAIRRIDGYWWGLNAYGTKKRLEVLKKRIAALKRGSRK